MSTITPIRDKVLAKMIDGFGHFTTSAGLIIAEKEMTSESIRPRWFEILFTGPEQEDVKPGEFVLMAHGRWIRGIDYEGDKVYFLDNEEMLVVSEELPDGINDGKV